MERRKEGVKNTGEMVRQEGKKNRRKREEKREGLGILTNHSSFGQIIF